jgi:CheY-like chemotaxis protein
MPEQAENPAGELLGEVSHELRTPLNAVLGMLELSFDEPLSDELRDYLTTAYQSARRLATVLDDLVDLARARRGELHEESSPFDLRRALDAALVPLTREARARGQQLVVRANPNVPDRLLGDETAWRKIVAHLTDYVIRSTDARSIAVVVALVARDRQRVELALGVADELDGQADWPAAAAARQHGEPDSAGHHGGRLALAISREWIGHLGGALSVDPDRPTRVACTLPFELAGQTDDATQAGAGPRHAPPPKLNELAERALVVLVVDDVPANQKVVRAILERRGHRVEVAANGRQAVDRVRRDRFDVVLMDAQMPNMSGLEAATRIRSLRGHAGDVPIVAVTADTIEDDRAKCLESGMDDYLAKPVGATALVACVESYGDFQSVAIPAAALVRLGGDESLLRELIRLFQEDGPALAAKIRAGVDSRDVEAVAHAAHNLRGLALNFDAAPTVAAALAIERSAAQRQLADAGPALDDLEARLARLREVLEVHDRRLAFRAREAANQAADRH